MNDFEEFCDLLPSASTRKEDSLFLAKSGGITFCDYRMAVATLCELPAELRTALNLDAFSESNLVAGRLSSSHSSHSSSYYELLQLCQAWGYQIPASDSTTIARLGGGTERVEQDDGRMLAFRAAADRIYLLLGKHNVSERDFERAMEMIDRVPTASPSRSSLLKMIEEFRNYHLGKEADVRDP